MGGRERPNHFRFMLFHSGIQDPRMPKFLPKRYNSHPNHSNHLDPGWDERFKIAGRSCPEILELGCGSESKTILMLPARAASKTAWARALRNLGSWIPARIKIASMAAPEGAKSTRYDSAGCGSASLHFSGNVELHILVSRCICVYVCAKVMPRYAHTFIYL